MKPLGSIAALIAAIRDDAAVEADAMTANAERAAADVERQPAAGDDVPENRALAAARDRARIAVSQEDWLDVRDAIAQREEWIQRVVSAGITVLRERRDPADARESLIGLATEAVARLPDDVIEIAVSAADAELLDRNWRARVSRSGDPERIRIVPAAIDGGCLARTADGRASFDNTYGARAARLQAAWRNELADLYERVTSRISDALKAEAS